MSRTELPLKHIYIIYLEPPNPLPADFDAPEIRNNLLPTLLQIGRSSPFGGGAECGGGSTCRARDDMVSDNALLARSLPFSD